MLLLLTGMTRKIIRKIALLSIRETYISLRNIWGLLVHPYRTLRVIRVEKDLSQIFLLFVTPFTTGMVVISLLFLLKLIFKPIGLIGQALNLSLILLVTCYLLLVAYLVYWLIYYLRVRGRAKNVS